MTAPISDPHTPSPRPLSLLSICILVILVCCSFPLASWSTGWVHEEGLYALIIVLPLLLLHYYWARRQQIELRLPSLTFLLLLALSLCYNTLTNISFFAYFDLFLSNLLMCAGVMALLWGLLRYWSMILWLPLLYIGMLELFIYRQYGSTVNSLIIAETLESSSDDAKAYLTSTNLLAGGGVLLGVVILLLLQYMLFRSRRRAVLIFHGLLLCSLSCLISALPQEQDAGKWPIDESIQLGLAVREAVSHNIATVHEVERLPSPSEQPSSLPLLHGDEGIIVVLHIGESLLAQRMSLNGYHRKTTPLLDSNPRVINFPHSVATASETSQGHICILTDARRNIDYPDSKMRATTGSVFDLFTKHGFELTSFFGRKVTQQLKHDRVMKLLSSQSKKEYYNTGLFAETGQHLKTHLAAHATGTAARNNQILFICNEGSHTPFNHYDKENPPFTPTIDSFNDPQSQFLEINNAYDNTVHYTDAFIADVLQQLQGRPFLYLYVSDHGEFLGEKGIWGRGALGDRQELYLTSSACHIGMFAVASPEFEALHPHFAAAMAQLKSNSQMIVSHEHIFHTLLGMVKLQTPYYNPELDLSSDRALPYSGQHPFTISAPTSTPTTSTR